ncbi:MAG TPA: glycosyltransferase family 39 protein [Isosphaeraceae bacterium]|jgi:4-amino-4-deoxy-L-arabinose transferase-like glycosyltransferase|nr:glycosyltransferase family 39 protein [Isosphaeraceae bacterium]
MTTARREALAIAISTLVGAVLRLWSFGRLGLSHFDEGIYAIAGLWSSDPAGLASLDPKVIPYYAPPGFPILVGIGYLILPWGISDLSAIFVAELCAIATIPVVGWLGRRTFGPGAGAAASALATWSGQHVAFARMAMTDAPFLLAWLVALGLGGRFLERPTIGRAIALGVSVGVAMNLKYNGWLAGVIVAVAAMFGTGKGRGRTLGLLGIAAAVAIVSYLPWFLFVERHDGYRALLRHQRSYAGGLSTWLPHLLAQLDQSVALSGGWTWVAIGWALACSTAMATTVGRVPPGAVVSLARSRGRIALFETAAMALWPAFLWWTCLFWVVSGRCAGPFRRLLAVAWVVLSILTPFYHPYARLWLPVLAAGWIIAGGIIAAEMKGEPGLTGEGKRMGRLRTALFVAAAVACLLTLVSRIRTIQHRPGPPGSGWAFVEPQPRPGLLRPTDGLRVAVTTRLVPRLRGDKVDSLVVLARPSALFYLASTWDRPSRRLPDFETVFRLNDDSRWALLDVALLAQEASLANAEDPARAVSDRLARQGWVERLRLKAPAALPTVLDIELGNPSLRRSQAEPTDLFLYERARGNPRR